MTVPSVYRTSERGREIFGGCVKSTLFQFFIDRREKEGDGDKKKFRS